MPIDAHVHFFTRSLLSERAGRWLTVMRTAALAEGLVHRDDRGGAADPAALVEALEAGLKDTSEAVLASLDLRYGPDWSYVPLMVDLEFAMEDDAGDPFPGDPPGAWPQPIRHAQWENESEFQLRRRIWNRVEGAWKAVSGNGLEIGARKMLADDSFEIQRRDLTALRAAVPDRVFPFLGIDPRREYRTGISLTEMVGDFVGPGRPFAGVKLYAAGGFSPTDPVLFGPRGLYAHCRRHRIPITVHFAPGGFATPLPGVRIRGDVYHPLYGSAVAAEEAWPGGRVEFDEKMTPGNIRRAVAERQMKLNHPRLWEKVLERWPGLVVNFAHAGGETQSGAWLARPGGGDWMSWALRQAARRRGVYVDLSAHAGGEAGLPVLVQAIRRRHPRLRRKLLYGSDYFLSYLKEADPRSYRDNHRDALGPWWTAASVGNPRRYLAGGIGNRRLG